MARKTDWTQYKAAQPLSLFHSKNPTEQDLELGLRLVCAGKLLPNKQAFAESSRMANEVCQVFAEKHAKYYRHRVTDWRKSVEGNRGVLGCCSRAAAQAELLRTSVSDYLEAQFWFFDMAFARAPTYSEIASPGALLRYKKWRIARVHDGVPAVTVSVATSGRMNPSKTKKEVEMAYEIQVLSRMIEQWGSEEKVWEVVGTEEVFSEDFKRSRDIWNKMYSTNKKFPE